MPPRLSWYRTVEGRKVRVEIVVESVRGTGWWQCYLPRGRTSRFSRVPPSSRCAAGSSQRSPCRILGGLAEALVALLTRSHKVVEAMICGVLGELHPLDAVGADRMVTTLWSTSAGIVTDIAPSPGRSRPADHRRRPRCPANQLAGYARRRSFDPAGGRPHLLTTTKHLGDRPGDRPHFGCRLTTQGRWATQ